MKSETKKDKVDRTHQALTSKLLAAAREYQSTDKAAQRFVEIQKFFDSLDTSKPHPGVKIDEIDLSQNDREIDTESNNFKALVESIKYQGLLQRPVLTMGVSIQKPFLCVAGHRRILAYQSLGHKVVPAELILSKNEAQIRLARLAENVVRQNLEPLELAEAVLNLKSDLRENIQGVARILNKNRNYITRLLKIANWPDEAKDLIRNNKFTQKQLIEIAMKKLDDDEVVEVLERIIGSSNATPGSKKRSGATSTGFSISNKKKIENYFEQNMINNDTQDKIMDFLVHMKIKGWVPELEKMESLETKTPKA